MNGWSLTDDTNNLTKWQFPNVTLLDAEDANESDNIMVVFASGKNRTNNIAELHTNFRLPTSGGFLALVDPNTNIVAVFNGYPAQQADVSTTGWMPPIRRARDILRYRLPGIRLR